MVKTTEKQEEDTSLELGPRIERPTWVQPHSAHAGWWRLCIWCFFVAD